MKNIYAPTLKSSFLAIFFSKRELGCSLEDLWTFRYPAFRYPEHFATLLEVILQHYTFATHLNITVHTPQ